MTALATLLFAALSSYLIYRFTPRRDERTFRLELFRPYAPIADWTRSQYDDQRRYSDLAAIYGRNDVPDRVLPDIEDAVRPIGGSAPVGPSRKLGATASVQCVGSTRKATPLLVIDPADPAVKPLLISTLDNANKSSRR
ncbi:hypothetical protein AB0C34_10295 [Nocardia sp. NPDC049220]|uniref:hypothetical protein n=1 Tax=Nocardia sp. NPDC049220 TaxID=3155273 RepID=UPI0034093B6D